MFRNARFIGTDGSCGLKNGEVYLIEIVETHAPYRFYVIVNGLGIPYDTMAAIKKNWRFIAL